MFTNMARKFFGSSNDRLLRSLQPVVEQINALEKDMEALSDEKLREKTTEFKQRLDNDEPLDALLIEAFAVVREVSKRTLGLRHFDVQLIGGIVLHRGMISEMKTGEGKTLVATLPAYLNALTGKGVHIVTVNDYLARRDAEWMGKIFTFLGLSVSTLLHGMRDTERKEAYACDILYATNNELGFDYLRDNMKFHKDEMVQRRFHYAIIDEVDSILIDEARTPLIISGPVEDNSELYVTIDRYIPKLESPHYEMDEKNKTVVLSEDGTHHVEELLKKDGVIDAESSLYDMENMAIVHHVDQALKAHKLFQADRDYIVKDNKVVIIDEFTGRMMEGRRYSEGLHQALEAKERVAIQDENQTLASITFQNYFRMYEKLSGMTGTAMTEAAEFSDIYNLNVVEIPTNVPVMRVDDDDAIYRTAEEKYEAIIDLISKAHKKKQPVLVGTVSIDKSEFLGKLLKKKKIPHHVLNARYHEKEAQIIAQAGKPGAVTIATNMAGRGTDIQLGGNPEMLAQEKLSGETDSAKHQKITEELKKQVEKDKATVIAAGGLCVIGTERHESRRIDNQLRGRSGRQGDPGYTKFFLSLEDDLLRIFGADKKMDFVMRAMGIPGEPITHPMLTRTLEKAQQKVEGMHYEIRKNLLKFDDVMNDQRSVIYEQRIEIMEADDVHDTIVDMRSSQVAQIVGFHIPEKAYHEEWDLEGLEKEVFRIFGMQFNVQEWGKEEGVADSEILERLHTAISEHFEKKFSQYPEEVRKDIEKRLLLFTLDELWKDHLHSLDHLRQGINLRAYGQKDPLNEYKREAFQLFEAMLTSLQETVLMRLSHIEIQLDPEGELPPMMKRRQRMIESRRDPAAASANASAEPVVTIVKNRPAEERDAANPDTWGKVGRNEPCPCGSGKKYKHCHGQLSV